MSAIGIPGFPSFPAGGFFGVTGSALGELGPGLIIAQRSIQDLVADVTVEERHDDRLTITQHPVEKTASITDHAYKEPPTVTIRCGWSASSPSAQGDPNYPITIYNQLLNYQNTVELLTVMTGKRQYTNMLLAEIEIMTDESAEYALMAILTFQYVILVETQITSLPANDVQADPAASGSTADLGAQSLISNPQINQPALDSSLANGASIPYAPGP